ncbi:MAG: serine/threonine protein phosphatase [Rhodospirillaceae bacterium]|nr:serine/threonine protein phosphatase [Rhodospirillaceae bacterium]
MNASAHAIAIDPPPFPPAVPTGTRVYAIGDIHGRYDLLKMLHDQIAHDAAARPTERHVLVYVGDYIDRGRQSFEVVETLIDAPLDGFEITHLKGNHEDFLLKFVETGGSGDNWVFNGGMATLASYGIESTGEFGTAGNLAEIRTSLIEIPPSSHLNFFQGLKLSHVEGDYMFVHAGVRPGIPYDQQDDEDLIWIRGPFLHANDDFGKFVIHGHTPDFEPVIRTNRICLDTFAYRSGCLTCIVLEGDERRFLQT